MYTAMGLSNYIVYKCIKDGCPISNLQLQKILYYIQKRFLDMGSIAFNDRIEAWQFGPVVPNVYYRFCVFGSMPISNLIGSHNLFGSDLRIVDEVVEEKRSLYPWELVSETHKENGAWARTYNNGAGLHQVIPVSLIKAVG